MAFTLLVVDDSEIIRAALIRAIQMTKIGVDDIIEAANGVEALARMEMSWVDLVLTDIHMPVMSGLDLIDTMNGRPDLSEIPIVVISTEGSASRIDMLKSKGVKGYLRKPFTPEAIRDVLCNALENDDGQ